MESAEILDGLLISYLSGKASVKEVSDAVAWINADEKNRKYFETLKGVWRLAAANKTMDKIDVDFEWEIFRQKLAEKQANAFSMHDPADQNEGDADPDVPVRKITFTRTLVAIAASLIIILTLGWGWMRSGHIEKPPVAKANTETNRIVLPPLHHEINNSGKAKNIYLEDGSYIVLSDKSELSYKVPFDAGRRDIFLSGKADFKVAKDKSRPFTVHCENLATTALGTRFTVSGDKLSENISVVLYEGKVVVKSEKEPGEKMEDFYLVPGQQLVYNKLKNVATLSNFNPGTSGHGEVTKSTKLANDNPTPPHHKGSWYMFNNRPLSEVFDQLQQMYNVNIEYSKKDISKIYFIGEFEKSDSIEKILKTIAISNNLTVKKEGNKFSVSK